MRHKSRFVVVGLLVATAAVSGGTAPPPAGAANSVAAARRLKPWEPVDPVFNGCANGFCGSRRPNARVSEQPGAATGQQVYCPVSGVLLRIKDSTLKVDVRGKPVYVCCEGCRRYFEANRDHVLGLRGLAASVKKSTADQSAAAGVAVR